MPLSSILSIQNLYTTVKFSIPQIQYTTTCNYQVCNLSPLCRMRTSIGLVLPRSSSVQAKWPTLRGSARTGSTLVECSSRSIFEAGCSGRSLSPCGRPPYVCKPMPGGCWPGGGWGRLNLCLLNLLCAEDPLQECTMTSFYCGENDLIMCCCAL